MNERKIILIVGPSGVGKTSAYRLIQERFLTCHFHHLDGLASDWALELRWLAEARVCLLRRYLNDDQLFLAFGLESIGILAGRKSDKHLIIDVGAGFQDARSAQNLHRIHNIIAITADPRVVYERIRTRPAEQRSFEEYKSQEFTERRKKVYSSAHDSIDSTSLTVADTANRLAIIVERLTGMAHTAEQNAPPVRPRE